MNGADTCSEQDATRGLTGKDLALAHIVNDRVFCFSHGGRACRCIVAFHGPEELEKRLGETGMHSDFERARLLIHDLEIAAQERKNQQRRGKLMDLANELDAGRVKHRFEARSASLNALRLEAVKELRKDAAATQQEKELPGPDSGAWVHWACNLQEGKDSLVLATLHRDFGALERFIGEMEESYWMPGERANQPSDASIRSAKGPVAESLASR